MVLLRAHINDGAVSYREEPERPRPEERPRPLAECEALPRPELRVLVLLVSDRLLLLDERDVRAIFKCYDE